MISRGARPARPLRLLLFAAAAVASIGHAPPPTTRTNKTDAPPLLLLPGDGFAGIPIGRFDMNRTSYADFSSDNALWTALVFLSGPLSFGNDIVLEYDNQVRAQSKALSSLALSLDFSAEDSAFPCRLSACLVCLSVCLPGCQRNQHLSPRMELVVATAGTAFNMLLHAGFILVAAVLLKCRVGFPESASQFVCGE
eukprot:SAG22_NODE_1436_length_4421_cov_9.840583_5_plen_196_part_00